MSKKESCEGLYTIGNDRCMDCKREIFCDDEHRKEMGSEKCASSRFEIYTGENYLEHFQGKQIDITMPDMDAEL